MRARGQQVWEGLRGAVVLGFEVFLRPAPVVGALGVLMLVLAVWDLAWWVAFDNSVLDSAVVFPALALGYMCMRGNYYKHQVRQQRARSVGGRT